MRLLINRRLGVLALATAAGVLCAAGPASADVTVSPPSAPQGAGENLTFRVTNESPTAAITKVRIALPADTAVAEIYPLSVPDWAPQIEQKHLATPLTTIHGGTPVTEATSAVTWTAMPGKALAPGRSADLSLAVGPLPATTSMRFTVQPTYAGTAGGPVPAPVELKLTPAAPGQRATTHDEHGTTGGATDTGTSADEVQFAQLISDAEAGPGGWTIAGWIAAALFAALGVAALLRSRHRSGQEQERHRSGQEQDEPADEPDGDENTEETDEDKEPVAAGTGKATVTSWSYQDGP